MLLRMLWHLVEMSMILSVPSIRSLHRHHMHTARKSAQHITTGAGGSLLMATKHSNAFGLLGTAGDHSTGHVLPSYMLEVTTGICHWCCGVLAVVGIELRPESRLDPWDQVEMTGGTWAHDVPASSHSNHPNRNKGDNCEHSTPSTCIHSVVTAVTCRSRPPTAAAAGSCPLSPCGSAPQSA
jgi:hypothetical protein